MNNFDSVVASVVIIAYSLALYLLGRAHGRRGSWQDGYAQGVADTTKNLFKQTVRAMANSASGRNRPRIPDSGRARARASVAGVALRDEDTVVVKLFPKGKSEAA